MCICQVGMRKNKPTVEISDDKQDKSTCNTRGDKEGSNKWRKRDTGTRQFLKQNLRQNSWFLVPYLVEVRECESCLGLARSSFITRLRYGRSTGRMLHKIIKEGKKKGRDMYSRFNVFELNRSVLLLIQICLESFFVVGISMMDVFQ